MDNILRTVSLLTAMTVLVQSVSLTSAPDQVKDRDAMSLIVQSESNISVSPTLTSSTTAAKTTTTTTTTTTTSTPTTTTSTPTKAPDTNLVEPILHVNLWTMICNGEQPRLLALKPAVGMMAECLDVESSSGNPLADLAVCYLIKSGAIKAGLDGFLTEFLGKILPRNAVALREGIDRCVDQLTSIAQDQVLILLQCLGMEFLAICQL